MDLGLAILGWLILGVFALVPVIWVLIMVARRVRDVLARIRGVE